MKTPRALFPLLALACTAGFSLSCDTSVRDPDRQDRADAGVSTMAVALTEGDPGTSTNPRPYSADNVTYGVHIEAHGADGAVLDGFDGWVVMRVNPGTMTRIDGVNGTEVVGRNVHLVGGQGDVRVNFLRAYGETRIWAEEDGYVPADVSRDPPPACANGVDDDGDGQMDYPADFGCAAANDDSEEGGSYAAAASEPIYFASPHIYDVQGASTVSPLENERITITAGNLIVTRISIQGFWVTDTSETHTCPDPVDPTLSRPCYNSIFSFNFRLPDGMRPCDRLLMVQGTVQEFAGTTQFNQPAWTQDPDGLFFGTLSDGTMQTCPIPDAIEMGPAALVNGNRTLEPYESSLVIARGLHLSANVGPDHPTCTGDTMGGTCDFAPGRSNCDYTGDSKIDFDNPDEARCSNACQVGVGCSEWTNWLRFGQVSVDFATGQMAGVQRLVIAPKTAVPDFDPQHPVGINVGDPTQTITATGTLKQVGPNWIIEPRCTDDLVFPGQSVLPANASCLIPRPPPEE